MAARLLISNVSAGAGTFADLEGVLQSEGRAADAMGAVWGKEPACTHEGGFHDLSSTDIDGTAVDFSMFKGRVVLLTNVPRRRVFFGAHASRG